MTRSFSVDDVVALKRALRVRAPEYRFTEEDIKELGSSTGLSAALIERWRVNVVQRYVTDATKEKFFSDAQVQW